jgi:hypothetical protein
MSSKILSDGKKTCIRLIKTRSRMNWGQRQDTHYKRHNIYNFYTTLKTKNWITLTSIKTRGEIRCPIANTMVKHTKKAKLNIMHMTVNFLELFFPDRQNIFQSDKIFMSVSANDWQLLSKFREVCLWYKMWTYDFFDKHGCTYWRIKKKLTLCKHVPCNTITHSTNEDLLNIKRKGDPEVSYPLSYVRYHWNLCVIKVILLACFTYIDIF